MAKEKKVIERKKETRRFFPSFVLFLFFQLVPVHTSSRWSDCWVVSCPLARREPEADWGWWSTTVWQLLREREESEPTEKRREQRLGDTVRASSFYREASRRRRRRARLPSLSSRVGKGPWFDYGCYVFHHPKKLVAGSFFSWHDPLYVMTFFCRSCCCCRHPPSAQMKSD